MTRKTITQSELKALAAWGFSASDLDADVVPDQPPTEGELLLTELRQLRKDVKDMRDVMLLLFSGPNIARAIKRWDDEGLPGAS